MEQIFIYTSWIPLNLNIIYIHYKVGFIKWRQQEGFVLTLATHQATLCPHVLALSQRKIYCWFDRK